VRTAIAARAAFVPLAVGSDGVGEIFRVRLCRVSFSLIAETV
jgi:hypothetical protein